MCRLQNMKWNPCCTTTVGERNNQKDHNLYRQGVSGPAPGELLLQTSAPTHLSVIIMQP